MMSCQGSGEILDKSRLCEVQLLDPDFILLAQVHVIMNGECAGERRSRIEVVYTHKTIHLLSIRMDV